MTRVMARVAVLAALLVGSADLSAAAMADARAAPDAATEDSGDHPDWMLLSIACVTLVVGRAVAYRRRKVDRTPRPKT